MEVQEAANHLQAHIDEDANFIWGWVNDDSMGEDIQMVVIATGFERSAGAEPANRFAEPLGGKMDYQAMPEAQGDQSETLFSVDSPLDTPSYLRRKHRK
jgi:cell division GTPase FtsZ